MRRKSIVILVIVIAIPVVIFGWDRYKNQHISVTVSQKTSLYATETDAAYGSPTPIKTISPGESLKVERTVYGKDYWALLVEAPYGTDGWIIAGQKGIRIEK